MMAIQLRDSSKRSNKGMGMGSFHWYIKQFSSQDIACTIKTWKNYISYL